MKSLLKPLAVLTLIVGAGAAMAKPPHHGFEFSEERAAEMTERKLTAVDSLGLDDNTASAVKSEITSFDQQAQTLMKEHMGEMQALREQHHTTMSSLLSEEELESLKSTLRPERHKGFGKGDRFRPSADEAVTE